MNGRSAHCARAAYRWYTSPTAAPRARNTIGVYTWSASKRESQSGRAESHPGLGASATR